MSELQAREPLRGDDPDVAYSTIAALALNVPLVMIGASVFGGVLGSVVFAAIERGTASIIATGVGMIVLIAGWMVWAKTHTTTAGVRQWASARVALTVVVVTGAAIWFLERQWPRLHSTTSRVGTVATAVILAATLIALVTRSALRRRRTADLHAQRTLKSVQALVDGVEPAWVRRLERRLDDLEHSLATPGAAPAVMDGSMTWRRWWRLAPWRQQ